VTDGWPEAAVAVSGVTGDSVSRSASNVSPSTEKSVQSAIVKMLPVVLLTSPERFGAWLSAVRPALRTAKFDRTPVTAPPVDSVPVAEPERYVHPVNVVEVFPV
jgi:hypothetical protein